MTGPDAGRQLVAERGLTPAAVTALIPLVAGVGFEELGLVKALLRRFFSADSWSAREAATLASAIGPAPPDGDHVTTLDLDRDLTLIAGWVDGTFVLDVEVAAAVEERPVLPDPPGPTADLGRTFASGVVPQPTPNPRTIRFATARRALPVAGASFRRDQTVDEPVAAIFAVAEDVVDVLVGADFVAVSLRRPDRWPDLLGPVLDAVAGAFGGDPVEAPEDIELAGPDVRGIRASTGPAPSTERRRTRLERAWDDLGRLQAGTAADLELVLAAARDEDSARRQVAAQLLTDAPEDAAAAAWRELVDDPSRAVRRATVDAIAGVEREALRPLLERATTDADGWTRWKALHGLAALGAAPSIDVIARLEGDPDFRVRLEAANAREAMAYRRLGRTVSRGPAG